MKIQAVMLMICLAFAATGALAHGGEEHVMGTVTTVTDKSITVKTAAKEPVIVTVGAATKFIKSKTAAKLADLSVGDRVVIHAVEGADKKLTADTVEFGPVAKPASARPTASQRSTAPTASPKR